MSETKQERKIIQIAAIPCSRIEIGPYSAVYHKSEVYALCDDGTLWGRTTDHQEWEKIAPIPQDAQ